LRCCKIIRGEIIIANELENVAVQTLVPDLVTTLIWPPPARPILLSSRCARL